MTTTSTLLTLLAGAIGMLAAIWWLRASRVQVVPTWGNGCEPGDSEASQRGWTAGLIAASMTSGRLNAQAALLTAVSVALGSIGAIVGQLAP